MLNNRFAGDALKKLDKFYEAGLVMNGQIVLCKGYNDGAELERTLADLTGLKNLLSIAVVPVGVTKFRKEKLLQVDKLKAIETIEIIDEFNKKIKKNLISVSDEFYLLAQKPFPEKKYYNGYRQLEDGVGVSRLLLDDFYKRKLPEKIKKNKKVLLFTGESAFPTLKIIADEMNKVQNFEIRVLPVRSEFWGKTITVTGLITGQDLKNAILNQKPIDAEVYIPSVMLRDFTEDFLDGMTVKEIEQITGVQINIIKDCYSAKDLIKLLK